MKRLIILVFLFICLVAETNAQEKIWGIGGNTGGNLLFGETRVTDSKVGLNTGLYGIYQLSPKISFKLQLSYGKFGIFKTDQISTDLNTSFVPVELNCLYSLSPNSSVNPFLHFGIGAMGFKLNGSPVYYDGLFIGGGGMSVPINSKLSFLATADIRYSTGDDFNGINNGLKDAYISFQTGFTYYLNDSPQEFRKKQQLEKNRIIAQKEQERSLEIVQLGTTISNLQNEFKKRDAEILELKEFVTIRMNKIQTLETQIAEMKGNINRPEPVRSSENYSPGQADELYDKALEKYYTRDYQAAINDLTDLYVKFSDHFLASNFIYWIGESYFGMKNYSEAAKSFNQVAGYSGSSKLDDALIMAGSSYLKSGDFENAKSKFEQLIGQFPGSEYIGRANRYLQSIQTRIVS